MKLFYTRISNINLRNLIYTEGYYSSEEKYI